MGIDGNRVTNPMNALGIIAGNGDFPLALAGSARAQGVKRLVAVGFPGITSKKLQGLVDEMVWVGVGQIGKLLKAFQSKAIHEVVMVGQIPHRLALRALKFDAEGVRFFKAIRENNAKTVLGGLIQYLEDQGLGFLDSTQFLKDPLAKEGVLSRKTPTEEELQDLKYGWRIARQLADLEVGQTVVVRKGVLVAVEGMDGTDATIRRGGKLAGKGAVVVKAARTHQDMRYDVPVVGLGTLKSLKRARAALLGIEAGKTLILDREAFLRAADRMGLAVVGISCH